MPPSTPPPAYDWPRTYLLSIYAAAVEHGHLLINPIDRDAANSLRMSLIRQRRRSDTANAPFIRPEYHLVSVGKWTSANGGTLPIIYSSMPNLALPPIRTLAGEVITLGLTPPPTVPNHEAPAPAATLAADLDIDNYLSTLIDESHKLTSGAGEDPPA